MVDRTNGARFLQILLRASASGVFAGRRLWFSPRVLFGLAPTKLQTYASKVPKSFLNFQDMLGVTIV